MIEFSDLTERLNRINFSENIKEISYKKFSDIINGDNYRVSKRDGLPEKYNGDTTLTYLTINENCICAIKITNDNVRILHIESLEKGLGRKMLQYIIDKYSKDHEITLHANGDKRLVNYYESIGFELINDDNEMVYNK